MYIHDNSTMKRVCPFEIISCSDFKWGNSKLSIKKKCLYYTGIVLPSVKEKNKSCQVKINDLYTT